MPSSGEVVLFTVCVCVCLCASTCYSTLYGRPLHGFPPLFPSISSLFPPYSDPSCCPYNFASYPFLHPSPPSPSPPLSPNPFPAPPLFLLFYLTPPSVPPLLFNPPPSVPPLIYNFPCSSGYYNRGGDKS